MDAHGSSEPRQTQAPRGSSFQLKGPKVLQGSSSIAGRALDLDKNQTIGRSSGDLAKRHRGSVALYGRLKSSLPAYSLRLECTTCTAALYAHPRDLSQHTVGSSRMTGKIGNRDAFQRSAHVEADEIRVQERSSMPVDALKKTSGGSTDVAMTRRAPPCARS